jgi:hypothetical protein
MATVQLSTLLEILVFDALVEIFLAVDVQKQLCTVRIATRPARLHAQLFLSTGAADVLFIVHRLLTSVQKQLPEQYIHSYQGIALLFYRSRLHLTYRHVSSSTIHCEYKIGKFLESYRNAVYQTLLSL